MEVLYVETLDGEAFLNELEEIAVSHIAAERLHGNKHAVSLRISESTYLKLLALSGEKPGFKPRRFERAFTVHFEDLLDLIKRIRLSGVPHEAL